MSALEPPRGPEPGVPAWVPDPGGRHQLRWWDGRAYTALVADSGVQGVDPLPPGVPTTPPAPPTPTPSGPPLTAASPTTATWSQAAAAASAAAGAPAAAAPGAGPVAESSKGRRRALLVVGAVVVVAVVAIGLLAGGEVGDAIGGGDDGGTGTFDGEVAATELGAHDVTVGPTEVLIARVRPDPGVDVVVGLLVDGSGAARLEELYGEVAGRAAPAEAFAFADAAAVEELAADRGGDAVVLRSDLGFGGEEESVMVAAGVDLEATLVVAPFGDAAGGYTVEIERHPLELDEAAAAGADGVALLEAVQRSREVPTRALDLAADLLELLEEAAEP